MPTTPDPAGVLVARAWLEDGDAGSLRVRLSTTSGADGGGPGTVVVASVDEACAEVRRWLETLVADVRERP